MPIYLTIIPVTAGILVGYYLVVIRSRQLLLVLYHLPYIFWRSYKDLYDATGTKFTFEMIGRKRFKNHKDFLIQYEELSQQSETRFKAIWGKHAYFIIRDYGIVLAVSTALFWHNYYAFIGPFILTQIIYLLYLHFYKKYDFYIFKIMMIELITIT